MSAKHSDSVALAVVSQRLEYATKAMEQVNRDVSAWNAEKGEIIKQAALQHGRIEWLEKENSTQWKRLDWQYKAVWIVIVSQIIMIMLLFGAKFIPLIRLP